MECYGIECHVVIYETMLVMRAIKENAEVNAEVSNLCVIEWWWFAVGEGILILI